MIPSYALERSNVLFGGQRALLYKDVATTIYYALRRKMRLVNYDTEFFADLEEKGFSSISWNFTRHNWNHDAQWVTFSAWKCEDGTYRLQCFGPQAEQALRRINTGVVRGIAPRIKKRLAEVNTRRRRRKRNLKKTSEHTPAPVQLKKKKPFSAAPLSKERYEVLTPQFRHNRFSWTEALQVTARIFEVQGNEKRSARQVVARELWRSLEQNGFRFAQFKRRGFCLRFDLADGIWRGDITPITVACTKDNAHPTYRRMRKHLKEKFLGLPPSAQRKRATLLWPDDGRIAA